MKTLFNFLAVVLLLTACGKGLEFENNPIEGKVVIADPYTLLPAVPASSATIYISEEKDIIGYFYKVLSESDGKFTFSHRPTGINLCMRAELSIGNLKYNSTALNISFAKDSSLKLVPKYNNGLIITTQDTINSKKAEVLNGVKVYVFSSAIAADSAMNTNKADADIKLFTQMVSSNEYGRAFFPNLTAGMTYYVVGKWQGLPKKPVLKKITLDPIFKYETLDF